MKSMLFFQCCSLSLDIPLDIPWACREHTVGHPRGKRKKRTAEIIYGIAKTIEKTKNNKKTKISEPMCSQSHRGNQKTTRKPRFQNQWVTTTIEKTKQKQDFRTNDREPDSLILKSCFFCFVWFSLWSWLPIGSEILIFLCVLVFSVVLATHWFWNLGFLVFVGFLDGFGYPLVLKSWFSCFCLYSLWFWLSIDSGILVVLVLSTVFGYPLILSG